MKLLKKKSESTAPVVEEKPKFTDLRQVMDYTRPLAIFYSGVEYESYLDILYDLGIRNFLMSYEYLKGKGHGQIRKYHDISLFIDSGAFTYMSDPKYESYTVEQWEKQIKEYLNWAERNKEHIFAIADLDLQYIVGYETVYEWRKKYFEPFMLRTGIPVCFMYHEEGLDHWEYMCKRYPYVGMSLRVDGVLDENLFRDMFRTAEKYNTLVQGMASTQTQLLTRLPFYTVDSTTWNVGLKYGEISVWNETKMSRIKKADFHNKAFPVISKYDKKFDFDKILDEDKTEMIRVNAYAFVMAEKFIHDRLKAKMYWLKAKTVATDLDNLPADFFPTPDWFNGDMADAEDYCKKMNINPDYAGVGDLLNDVTAFLNWDNPEYESIVSWYKEPEQEKLIEELHDFYINRIVPDKETRIADLISFFRDCVSGKNDKLLQLGTNFDRTVKERESYIEEDDTELADLPLSEVKKRLQNLLPDKSFEDDDGSDIMALDKEIYRQAEIVPTFDEHGKFVKGQVEVRKPKQVYSKKFPKLACDTCFAAAKCPEYKPGYVCAYNKMFDRFSSRDMADIIQGMQGIVDYNMQRMQKSMIMETINGSIDPVTTQLMEANIRYLNMLKSMYESGSAEVLKQTRVVRADGTTEETTSITNPQSGGIMEKLFSSLTQNKEDKEPTVVDTTAQEGTPK